MAYVGLELHTATKDAAARGLKLVRASRLPALLDAFARVSKKAAKYGQSPLTLHEGTTIPVLFPAQHATPEHPYRPAYYVDYVECAVKGDSFRIGGWRPVLKIENVGGNLFFTALGDAHTAIPAKYRDDSWQVIPCEHCGFKRRRKTGYVLVDEDGTWKLVGSTCLVDFTGHPDAEGLAAAIADYRSASGSLDEDMGWLGSYRPDTFETSLVLAYTARYIRAFGWASRKQAVEAATPLTATADTVQARLTADKRDQAIMEREGTWLHIEEPDRVLAQETRVTVLERLDALPADKITEFEHNLLTALKSDTCPLQIFGTACALFAVGERYKTREQQDTEHAARMAKAQHVAEPKKRLDLALRVTLVKDLGEGDWGRRILYKFEDRDGNQYTWFTTKFLHIGLGEHFGARATIKDHTEYRGVKENLLTRLTVTKEPEAKAPEGWTDLSIEERAYRAAKAGWRRHDDGAKHFIEHGVAVPATRHVGVSNREARDRDARIERFYSANHAAILAGFRRWAAEKRAREEATAPEHEAENPLETRGVA